MSHVSKGTRSCASLPMCCRFFVRQRERTRWPGLVKGFGSSLSVRVRVAGPGLPEARSEEAS